MASTASHTTAAPTFGSRVLQALAAPYVARRSGVLQFARAGERSSLRFRDGEVLWAATNVTQDRLGETLVRHGWLRRDELGPAWAMARQLGRRLGSVLVSMGLLEEGLLPHALGLHAKAVVEGLLGWPEGTHEFREDQGAPVAGRAPARPGTGDLIAQAVRRLDDEHVLRAALGDLDRALRPGQARPMTLSQAEALLRAQVDGVRTARQIVALRPDSTVETLRSLLALLYVGLVEWSPAAAGRGSSPSGAYDAGWLALIGGFAHEAELARAETFLSVERYWEAIQVLQKVLPRLASPALRQEAHVLLARAYLQNPNWVRRAEEALLCALDEGPPHADALYLLGNLYASQGLSRRAASVRRRLEGLPGRPRPKALLARGHY
jgi:tetratricopeptide (TPR) repeat protein